jgi:predicted Zn-dependent protease
MENIPVLFYDGQSSGGRRAVLNISSGVWKISYAGSDSQVHNVLWDVSELSEVEIINGGQVFRYGTFPQQILDCREFDLISLLKTHYSDLKILRNRRWKISGFKNAVAASLFLILLLGTLYFYVLPPFAAFLANQIPQNVEKQLGGSILNTFLKGAHQEEKLSILLNQFAKKINFKTDYQLEIVVVKNSDVNAFALPGGKIVVYDEILKRIKTPEELAALLAHEAAHIEYKHSLKSISRSLAGYLFISLLLNDINGISTVLIDNANALHNLSYSRSLETDADLRALETLKENQISQQGMVALFKTLSSKQDLSHLKFLSTHPLTAERIKYTTQIASKQKGVVRSTKLLPIWNSIKRSL